VQLQVFCIVFPRAPFDLAAAFCHNENSFVTIFNALQMEACMCYIIKGNANCIQWHKEGRLHSCLQVCATIGLCDAQQIPTPARKLLAQTLMQAQQTQQDDLPPELLRQIIPAEQRTAEKVGDSTQCQICEMAVNYVKVRKVIRCVFRLLDMPYSCQHILRARLSFMSLLT